MVGVTYVSTGAEIDGTYRYRLWRQWGPDPYHYALFIMLNPSTADAFVDDPTIRRCVGFARAWQFDRLEVCNLFAWRTKSPRDLRQALRDGHDIVGPRNNERILDAASKARCVVAAWGGNGSLARRDRVVLAMLERVRDVLSLRQIGSGAPEHPLYLPGELRPTVLREHRP